MMIETPTFGDWLKAELDERGWGILTLARRINPQNPELPRRALNHYVHGGVTPGDEYIGLIADALEIDREEVARRAAPFSKRSSA